MICLKPKNVWQEWPCFLFVQISLTSGIWIFRSAPHPAFCHLSSWWKAVKQSQLTDWGLENEGLVDPPKGSQTPRGP